MELQWLCPFGFSGLVDPSAVMGRRSEEMNRVHAIVSLSCYYGGVSGYSQLAFLVPKFQAPRRQSPFSGVFLRRDFHWALCRAVEALFTCPKLQLRCLEMARNVWAFSLRMTAQYRAIRIELNVHNVPFGFCILLPIPRNRKYRKVHWQGAIIVYSTNS